jgi:hypothetical protein
MSFIQPHTWYLSFPSSLLSSLPRSLLPLPIPLLPPSLHFFRNPLNPIIPTRHRLSQGRPNGHHARPHLTEQLLVLEIALVAVLGPAGPDLCAARLDLDFQHGRALQLGARRRDPRRRPPVGHDAVGDELERVKLLGQVGRVVLRDEVRAAEEHGGAVVVAVCLLLVKFMREGREGSRKKRGGVFTAVGSESEDEAVEMGGSDGDGETLGFGGADEVDDAGGDVAFDWVISLRENTC